MEHLPTRLVLTNTQLVHLPCSTVQSFSLQVTVVSQPPPHIQQGNQYLNTLEEIIFKHGVTKYIAFGGACSHQLLHSIHHDVFPT